MAAFDISRGHAPPASKTSRSDTVSEATTLVSDDGPTSLDSPSSWPKKSPDDHLLCDPVRSNEHVHKYPPDKFGDEASDNARVWNVYRDSAIETDNELLGRWNEALTAILVFAGLFSAVVTAFVIESTRRLQPDPAEYTARAVLAVLSHMNGSTISPIEVVNPAFFSAGATARTINSFWYFGLTTALAVSLLAILAKQWLLEYHARIRAPAKHARYWAWRHFAFKRGLEKWNIDLFISLLSFAMHLAFGSFFAGLLLTLFPVDWIVSAVVTLVTLSVFIVYSVATLAPLWLGDAPMLTPLLIHADRGMRAVISRVRSATAEISVAAFQETAVLNGVPARRDAELLFWVIETHPDPYVEGCAVDAIGSLDMQTVLCESGERSLKPWWRVDPEGRTANQIASRANARLAANIISKNLRAAACCLRTLVFLQEEVSPSVARMSQFDELTKTDEYDLKVLSRAVKTRSAPGSHTFSYADLIAELGAASGIKTSTPCHRSTVDLLFLAADNLDARLHVSTLATQSMLLDDDLSPLSSGHFILIRMESLVQAIAQRTGHSWKKPLDGLAWQLRALSVWGQILQTLDCYELNPGTEATLSASYMNLLLKCQDEVECDSTSVAHALSYFATKKVRYTSWTPESLSAITYLIRRAASTGTWSPDLGSLLFNLFHIIARSGSNAVGPSARLALSIFDEPSWAWWLQADALIADLGTHRSMRNLMTHTVLNLTQPRNITTERSESTISLAWRLARMSTTGERRLSIIKLCTDLAARLTVLHKLGIYVHDFSNGLLSGEMSSASLIRCDPEGAHKFARHARQLVPNWWAEARKELLSRSSPSWRSTHTFPTAHHFVELIDLDEKCEECRMVVDRASCALWKIHAGRMTRHS